MRTALILIISGIMIGAGFSIILRDLRRSRRRAFISERDARAVDEPEVEITVSSGRANGRASEIPSRRVGSAASPAGDRKPGGDYGGEDSSAAQDDADEGRRLPAIEQQWAALQPVIGAGVAQLNAELAPLRLVIGESGDPTWSYKNKGYGAYRRIMIADQSIGWLRLELSADGQLNASAKSHKDEGANINAAAQVAAAQLTTPRASTLLSQSLQPAAAYAAQNAPAANREKEASEKAWSAVEAVVTAALGATNGALAQAGARLLPLTPAIWEPEIRRHRMTLSLEINASTVARMHIERLANEIEVAVGVRDPHLVALGRRRRIPLEGLTIHGLAELIASCAWPTIARFREDRRSA
jgi:hypothetical protein